MKTKKYSEQKYKNTQLQTKNRIKFVCEYISTAEGLKQSAWLELYPMNSQHFLLVLQFCPFVIKFAYIYPMNSQRFISFYYAG